MRYQIYIDSAKEYRWRLWSANNQIVATSGEGYTTKQSCQQGIDLVKSAWNAPVVDDTGS